MKRTATLYIAALVMACTLSANPLRKNIPFIPRQQVFTMNVAKLIMYVNANGYQVTFGETVRSKDEAEANAKKGIGIRDSNHCYRMAIDLNFFKDGKYLKNGKDYKFAGTYWQSLNKYNEWFAKDGNHFEMDQI